MKKHYSPAPWRGCHDGNCHCGIIWAPANHSSVAYTLAMDDNELGQQCGVAPKSEEFYANMKLIAAAPELLEALEAMIQIFDTPRFNERFNPMQLKVLNRAKASVNKALTGKEIEEL